MKRFVKIFFLFLSVAFWIAACSSGTTGNNEEPQQDADAGQPADDGGADGGTDNDQADGLADQAGDTVGDPGDFEPELPIVRFRTTGQVTSENVRSVTTQLVLSKPGARDITVYYELSGTATDGEDYSVADGSQSPVTILATEVSRNLQIHIMGDGIDEATEEFKLTLTNAFGAQIGSPDSHTVILTGLNPLDDIKPGHWFEVPNSHLADHLPDPIPPNWGGPGSI
ncbi:MAG: hypothetical protein JRJ87_14635, partial [Deltaproteobacteria bacterium]|nr:hypothetical protein [Deltaproteobacteria bacterium]